MSTVFPQSAVTHLGMGEFTTNMGTMLIRTTQTATATATAKNKKQKTKHRIEQKSNPNIKLTEPKKQPQKTTKNQKTKKIKNQKSKNDNNNSNKHQIPSFCCRDCCGTQTFENLKLLEFQIQTKNTKARNIPKV